MPSFGEIRFRLSKLAPGVDLDLLDGWLLDRYQQILDALPWSRLEVETTVQSPAEYNTGTVTATAGSTAITGSGTVWTAGMTGRTIRIAGHNETYRFTRVSDTTGTLDRAFEWDTEAGLSYQINQNVFQLPSSSRIANGVYFRSGGRELERLSLADLNDMAPSRTLYGEPLYWAPCMDYSPSVPLPQVELYPIPDELWTFSVQHTSDAVSGDPATPSAAVLPWVRPGALIAGVSADIYGSPAFKDLAAADRAEARFTQLVKEMIATESASRPPARIQLPGRYTRHRVTRWAK